MPTPLRSGSSGWAIVPLAVVPLACVAACSGSSSTPGVQVATFSVVGVFPPDGASAMDRRTEVRVVFSEPVYGIGAEDLLVEDDAGPLGGLIEPSTDGRAWRWRPIRDLPYGGEIHIRLRPTLESGTGAIPATADVATFRVLDHVNQTEYLLGTTEDDRIGAMVWSNGQIFAANGRTLHDLSSPTGGAVQLPSASAPISYATDETGGYTALVLNGFAPFQLEAVHGSANGSALLSAIESSATVFGRTEHCANARGDAAVYRYSNALQSGDEALWLSPTGSAMWRNVPLADAGPYVLRRIALDAEGNLFVAYLNGVNGRLELMRHDRTSGESRVFDVGGMPDEFTLAAGSRGEARIWWHDRTTVGGVEHHLRLVRHFRDGRLLGAQEVYRGEAFADRAYVPMRGGGVVVVREDIATAVWSLQRFEGDGSIGEAVPVTTGRVAPVTMASATRGEVWFFWVEDSAAGDVIFGVRSRPGRLPGPARRIYEAEDVDQHVLTMRADVDDTGLVVLTFAEQHVGPIHRVKAITLQ